MSPRTPLTCVEGPAGATSLSQASQCLPRALGVPPASACPTCVWGSRALGAVQQPCPKHGEGLHVQPLVLREVLARGQHREEVRGHSPVHLGDRAWLWEARKAR